MSSKIKILSESLANKIAAGEVVERPASVVKELVENSIDAGAKEIIIDIKAGGRRSIRVLDDGEGMDGDDALLAIERHSTSKIFQEEDLFKIKTMGFRGEALPSIGSVSRMRITTKPDDSLAGTCIYSEGGKIKDVSEAGCPKGTTVEVNNLFYNTPARLKFLKTDNTELGHIVDVVTQTTLANPEIHFKLLHNDKIIINAPITKNLLNRMTAVLGRDVYENLYEVLLTQEAIDIRGFISQPNFTRSTGRAIYTYVNRRFVRDKVVNHAIMEAYRTLIMKNRYPVVILFINMPVHWVDVNVHPTKREVRFKEQQKVHGLIVEALQATLRKAPWIKERLVIPYETPPVDSKVEDHHHRIAESPVRYSSSPLPLFFSSLILISQVNNTYILCSCDEGLILVDQHAAHERVIFELLKEEYMNSSVVSQGLLVPQHIELGYREARFLEKHISKLSEVGLEVEPFGGDTFMVKSVPQILINKNYRQFILDIIDELYSYDKSFKLEESVEKILILMACHGAIKANQRLSPREIETLLQQLDSIGSSTNCPHGRPILRKITYQEIDRMFKRC
ncbi:MAG: DNA mismatch repair endonuclease MutL [Thermodesulfobacteriota bacterium]